MVNLDFKNDFTAAAASTTFIVLLTITVVVGFISLWLTSGSFLLALFFGVVMMLFVAPVLGGVIASVSWLFGLWLAGRQNYLNDRARAKLSKTSNISL